MTPPADKPMDRSADMQDDWYDPGDYENEVDELEEALSNCCGHFEADGVFWCGAAGSEDCDWECPFSRDIGLTAREIKIRDETEDEA